MNQRIGKTDDEQIRRWPDLRWYKSVGPQIPAVAFLLLALIIIYRRVVAGWVLAGGDLHTYFFPYWTASARSLQMGKLPLWNPYLFAGAPLLANSQMGAFYPLNWPLWLLSGSTLAGAARTLHWSLLLHLGLAAIAAYLLARRLGAGPWGAALSGLIYAGSGYLGVQVEHLNQLQGLAWLPMVLLPPKRHSGDSASGPQMPSVWSILALAMILLAGHTQTAFIAGVGLSVWWLMLIAGEPEHAPVLSIREGSRLVLSMAPFALAGLVAAAQLLPTLQLSRLSVRSGGLPWREAVSFSVRPWELPRALLPPYLLPPLLPEGVAYLGLVGTALAIWAVVRGILPLRGARRAARSPSPVIVSLVALAALGLFLALGGYNPLYLAAVRLGVPGLVHFRAPARFLALFVLAASVLAGLGLMALPGLRPANRRTHEGLWALVAPLTCLAALAELLFSAERLPHAAATAPRAYIDLRPATAHLVAATQSAVAEGQPPGRFLSISKTLFDPGDKAEMEEIYGEVLSPDALWAYFVAAKQREVLAPNLSLAFAVPAVDGYDGGLLPLRHYVAFSCLLLPEGTLDGRLRENLGAVPEGRWLSLMGVRFLITDKTGDAWTDDIFYDRQFQPHLEPGQALTPGWLPVDFEADALGLLYTGAGEAALTFVDGTMITLPLPGVETAEMVHRVRWETPGVLREVTLSASEPGLTLAGASLIDERTGAFYPVALSDRFRLVHSGDVKIYENLRPLPRAFLVHESRCAASDEAALAAMREPSFDPGSQVMLIGCESGVADGPGLAATDSMRGESATIVQYSDTTIVVNVVAAEKGVLVLPDVWYPGWQVEMTPLDAGESSLSTTPEVLRADLLFRAVVVEPGKWQATFVYRPILVSAGVAISALGLVALVGYARLVARKTGESPYRAG